MDLRTFDFPWVFVLTFLLLLADVLFFDGGENKEEATQDRGGQDRLTQSYKGRLQQYLQALRSWHIVGRLGGCNSMNMQLSQLPLDCKRPSYDALEGANITPTSFYNIGDFEIQDNLACVCTHDLKFKFGKEYMRHNLDL